MKKVPAKPDLHSLDWWTVRELANRWRCSPDTVLRMIHEQAIQAMQLKGAYRIHREAIEEHEKAARVRPEKARRPRVLSSKTPDLIGDLSRD